MNIPDNIRYTRDHEWVAEGDSARLRVGITDYAQDALGDIVFVQVPAIGTKVQAGITFSEVESTKSVSDIYAPVSGTIVEVNTDLSDSPQLVNEDPYGKGWICIIEPDADADTSHMLDAAAYKDLVGA